MSSITATPPQPPHVRATRRSQPQFDGHVYHGVLSYWGLPHDWPTIHPNGRGVEWCDAQQASNAGKKVWAHVNIPCRDAPPKAANSQIRVVQNLSLDFEYAPHPALAHVIGQRLAGWLVSEGLAAPGLAVEDSGAGVHIVVPLAPLFTAEYGGGERVNRAVAAVVQKVIQPRFAQLVTMCANTAPLKLEGYDIARVLSLPGTWRPADSKPDEATYLAHGYLRRYLPPYDRFPPLRCESRTLREMIVTACGELRVAVDAPPVGIETRPSHAIDPVAWLDEYVRRRTLPSDRSRGFQSLVAAVYLRFDAQTVLDVAGDIDRLCGSKYGQRARVEAERSLTKARQLPKTETVAPATHSHPQNV